MRISAKAGDGKVKVVFTDTPETGSDFGYWLWNSSTEWSKDDPTAVNPEGQREASAQGPRDRYITGPRSNRRSRTISEGAQSDRAPNTAAPHSPRENLECACERGKIRQQSISVSKGRQLDPAMEARAQRPTAYGQLVSSDNVIASASQEGEGGDRTAFHIRDHYSGVVSIYVAKQRNFANNLKAMIHFGGVRSCKGPM